jgi:hypothetical protein
MKLRFHRSMTLSALALLFAGSAIAAPVAGTYTSTDLGGSLLTGRGSQSWAAPLNANNGVGDVFNSLSWDGATLGTQWGFSCGIQTSPQGVVDNRVAGTGTVVFTNNFVGGTFYLNPGPWGDGTGTINATQVIATVQYVSFTPVASVVNINNSGEFDNSDCVLTFTIANGVGGGDTDAAPFPANYPALLDPSCAPTRTNGSWGDVRTITMRIDCPVPATQKTWGSLKSLYR